MAAGRLTEEQFKTRLRELMVEDEEGNWWMVGYETGEWYRHDGADWVRADPPGRVALRAAPVARAKPKARQFWGIVVLLLGLALTFGAGMGALEGLRFLEEVDAIMNDVCANAVLLCGLILTIVIARKVWRGK